MYSKVRQLVPKPIRDNISQRIFKFKRKLLRQTRFDHTYQGRLAMRIYFQESGIRLIFCEGFPTHNRDAMDHVRPTDILLCVLPCFVTKSTLERERDAISFLKLETKQVVLLCNTAEDVDNARKLGLQAEYINHNCWLDETIFRPREEIAKDLDAVLVSSPFPVKRPELSAQVTSKAVVTYAPYSDRLKEQLSIDEYFENLSNEEVAKVINRARVGLCLSAREGACYASSEYILSGIPVVTTPSKGGREIWYSPHNHLACRPQPDAVKQAVSSLIDREQDGHKIRQDHIRQATQFRETFVQLTTRLGASKGLDKSWAAVFQDEYYHKMVSFRPTEKVIGELKGVL